MYQYEVGKPYPHPHLLPRIDSCVAQIVGSSFDAIVCMDRPRSAEVKTFRDAFMRVHVLIKDHIPLAAFSYLGDPWTWDVSISVVGMTGVQAAEFFKDGNMVNLFLVDRRTSIIKAIRTIGLDHEVATSIKDACRQQLARCSNQAELSHAIDRVLATTSTQDVIYDGMRMEFRGRR